MAHIYKPKTRVGKVNWYVKYKDPGTGKWVRKSLKTPYKKTADLLLEKYDLIEKGIDEPEEITLLQWFEKHMVNEEKRRAKSWVYNKRWMTKKYIIPFFGENTLIKNIKADQITDYQNLRCDKVSNRTVNIEVNALMSMLRSAHKTGKMPHDYQLPFFEKMEEDGKPPRFLNDNEIKVLMKAAENHSPEMHCYCMLMLYAGLRSGEALNLPTRNIHLNKDHDLLQIAPYKIKNEKTGKIIEWTTKTHQQRSIPLSQKSKLVPFLKKRLRTIGDSQFIISGNGQFSAYRIKRLFLSVVRESGLPTKGDDRVTTHVLRHTYATRMYLKGVKLLELSRLLGHSSSKVTEIYTHIEDDRLKEVVNPIEF